MDHPAGRWAWSRVCGGERGFGTPNRASTRLANGRGHLLLSGFARYRWIRDVRLRLPMPSPSATRKKIGRGRNRLTACAHTYATHSTAHWFARQRTHVRRPAGCAFFVYTHIGCPDTHVESIGLSVGRGKGPEQRNEVESESPKLYYWKKLFFVEFWDNVSFEKQMKDICIATTFNIGWIRTKMTTRPYICVACVHVRMRSLFLSLSRSLSFSLFYSLRKIPQSTS